MEREWESEKEREIVERLLEGVSEREKRKRERQTDR